MTTLSNDPDDWDEAEWTRRLDLHAAKYGLDEASLLRAVDAINHDVVTIGSDGELITRDAEKVTLALMEIDLASQE